MRKTNKSNEPNSSNPNGSMDSNYSAWKSPYPLQQTDKNNMGGYFPNQSYPPYPYNQPEHMVNANAKQPYPKQNGYYTSYLNQPYRHPNQQSSHSGANSYGRNPYYNTANTSPLLPTPPKKQKNTRRTIIRICIVFLSIIILLLIGVILLWQYIFSDAKTNQTYPSSVSSESIAEPSETNAVVRDGKIINILLMGMDLTHGEKTSRADAIILATIDQEHEEIRLTSFQRDMLVHYAGTNIDGKLNGTTRQSPEVLVNTLNQTFHLDIKDYVMVDIAGAEDLVNAVDGIEINLPDNPAVIKYMNRLITEQNSERYGWNDRTNWSPMIQKGGLQKLNGTQAIAYARMRELDSDFFRMKRQQEVIQLTFKKLLHSNPFVMANTLKKGLSYVTSNMSAVEMTQMGISLIPKMKNPIKRLQIPIQGYYWSDNGGSWNIKANFNLMIPILHQFVYGETIGEFTSVPLFPYTPLDWTDTTVMPKGVKDGTYTGEAYAGPNGEPGGKPLNGADMVSEVPEEN